MSKHLQQSTSPQALKLPLSARATEALQLGKFKDAVQLFKQLVNQDSRPEWRDGLAAAYAGRARALAARGMFEEAEILLRKTATAAGTVREPLLYVQCLVKRGQQDKAAEHALKYIGTDSVSAPEASALADLTAALCLATPTPLDAPLERETERGKWIEGALAARQALAAWMDGKPWEQIDPLLSRIALRSAFKPLRVILKASSIAPHDPERARQLLQTVPSQSAFTCLRFAVEAALPAPADSMDQWSQACKAQRSFVAQVNGWSHEASECLERLAKAERTGPSALFSFLLQQKGKLPSNELMAACLNLLPQIPDRVSQFEKTFGPLSEFDKHRVLALAAEERSDWRSAERHWLAVAESLDHSGQADSKLGVAVIYRHLAHLAQENEELEDSRLAYYLEKSLDADPDHLPTTLHLLNHYRANNENKTWARLAEMAARRFPEDSAVLLQAIDAALERKAYKNAAGFARRLLVLDPFNQLARERMIAFQISLARKQVRAKRPELAWNELASAAEWERPDSPNFLLRINKGLVAMRLGRVTEAEVQLRQGVQLAGGGVAGWFRAARENQLMDGHETCSARLRQELARAREHDPTKEAILVVAAACCGGTRHMKRRVAELISDIRSWLLKGSTIAWATAEFHIIAQALRYVEAFDLLVEYAKLGSQRQPEDATWQFYQVVARTRDDPNKLSVSESQELLDLADKAAGQDDFHLANRICGFIDRSSASSRMTAPQIAFPLADFGVDDEFGELLALSLQDIPPAMVRNLVIELGESQAIKSLSRRLRNTPLGLILPDELIRKLARVMVESL